MGIYSLWPSYADVFKVENKNKRESIFEVQFANSDCQWWQLRFYVYAGYFKPSAAVVAPPYGTFGGYGDNPVTRNHYEAYSPGDLRRDANVMRVANAPSSIKDPYYVNKYQDAQALTVDDGANDYYLARYADVLLMYAEAKHEAEPENAEAYEVFNGAAKSFWTTVEQPFAL